MNHYHARLYRRLDPREPMKTGIHDVSVAVRDDLAAVRRARAAFAGRFDPSTDVIQVDELRVGEPPRTVCRFGA